MDTKDISVIVQGAINKNETIKCLQSIRQYLPGAEIILSTWEGSNITDLDYDNLILSKDPGAAIIEKSAQKVVYNNINRQLLSTQAGLEKASRRYAMKVRSDLILTSDRFLDYFDKFQARTDNYTLFNRKIIVPALFTRFNIKCDNLYERIKYLFMFLTGGCSVFVET